jgi:hypothetical protein
VGKHAAPDGSSAHPLVAAALAQRAADVAVSHREDARPATSQGGLGWPGPPPAPERGGLGWPGDASAAAGETRAEKPAASPLRPTLRRGWRRLFGLSRAA